MKTRATTFLILGICSLALLLGGPCPARAGKSVQVLSLWGDVPPLTTHLYYADPDAPKGGTLRIALAGTFDNFNRFASRGRFLPQVVMWTQARLGLPLPDDSSAVQGVIAESFEIAPDKLSLLVRLRPEARFSDGTPLTSADVVFTFNAIVKEGSPTFRDYYAQVSSAVAEGDHAVRFHFTTPDNFELPLILCELFIQPRHWWEGKSVGDPQTEPIPGCGPYRIKEFKMGSMVVYERIKDWWAADLPQNRGLYNFDTIRVDFYRDAGVAREAFFAGEADFYGEGNIKDWVTGYDVPDVRNGRIKRIEIPVTRSYGMNGFFMNTRNPFLADIRVRRALTMLYDFERTNKAMYYGKYSRSGSFFAGTDYEAPQLPGPDELALLEPYRDQLDPAVFGPLSPLPATDGSGNLRPNMLEALKLLNQAGWNLDKGVLRNEKGEEFHLIFLLSSKMLQRVLIPFQRNLSRVGIRLDIQLVDQTQYISRVRSLDFDMISSGARIANYPGNEQRYLWGSRHAKDNGTRNYPGVNDPVVDAVIEILVRSSTRQEITTAARVLDRLLQHGSYVIPDGVNKETYFSWRVDSMSPPPRMPNSGNDIAAWHMPRERSDR